MSRKETVIRLGRSRSPMRLKSKDGETSRYRMLSEASPRENSHTKEPLNLNKSMHPTSRQKIQSNTETLLMASSLHQFPLPSKRPLTNKENMISPQRISSMRPSPHKAVIYNTKPAPNTPSRVLVTQNVVLPRQTETVDNEKEVQLLRKIRALETRIQQLHKQKQVTVVKCHEENRKLVMEIQFLKNQLGQCERVKNGQIYGLQQQLAKLAHNLPPRGFHIAFEQQQQQQKAQSQKLDHLVNSNAERGSQNSFNSKKQLKNMVYVDENQDATSLVEEVIQHREQRTQRMHTRTQSEPVNVQNFQEERNKLLKEINDLAEKNKQVNIQLDEMKDAVLQTTALIEENNKNIVEEYQEKINRFQERIRDMEEKKNCQQELFLKQRFEWEEKISSIEGEREEISLKLEENNAQLLARITELEVLVDKRSAQLEIKSCKLQQMQQKQALRSSVDMQPEGAYQGSQSCRRCKQLIKTLVKLNQKTFSKTC